jgi:hypothetical protein
MSDRSPSLLRELLRGRFFIIIYLVKLRLC